MEKTRSYNLPLSCQAACFHQLFNESSMSETVKDNEDKLLSKMELNLFNMKEV